MKIGLFYENIANRNRTEEIFTSIFLDTFQARIFNATTGIDKESIRHFVEDNDILILHHYAFLYNDTDAPKTVKIDFFSENFQTIIRAHHMIIEVLNEIQKPTLIMFTRSDWYSHSETFWKSIPSYAYLFGGFKQGYLNTDPQDEAIFQKFGKNIDMGNRFIEDNRIIPAHHVLDHKEFSFNKQYTKKYDISVLGVLYSRRKYLYETLVHYDDLTVYNAKKLLRLRKLLNHFDKKQYQFNHHILSFLFKRAIAQSRMSYTDGSTLDMFVRKYIEIPAYKSVLLCDKFKKMEDFGFIENENFLAVDYAHLEEQLHAYLTDKDKLQAITQNGFALVIKNFSREAWEKRLALILHKLHHNTFHEATWTEGSLLIS